MYSQVWYHITLTQNRHEIYSFIGVRKDHKSFGDDSMDGSK